MNTGPESRQVRILLVDDQPARLLSYEAILRDLGHELVRASSGPQALEQLLEGEFALILLDVSMPGMDGFELAALVHDHPRFEKTPIIFVTGLHVTDFDRLKGYSLGAVDYVYVPVVPEILRSKVAVLTELYQKRRELQELNRSLERANAELFAANSSLQAEKTRDLEAANEALKSEIDERRKLEDALLETDRRKDEFLAMLAHELRNPLAPILNGVQYMRQRVLEDPGLEWCRDMIGRQAEQLTRLVDELLDVSRITQGKIKLQRARLALDEVVLRAVETNRPLIEARGQQLAVDLPAQPVHVLGDLTRLAQVVGNLLHNAAKFTEDGGTIRVAVETARRPDGAEEALIRVRDSGVGIPPEVLPRVFDLFTQFERPVAGAHVGLGIGLALVRRLVDLHGGRVEAHSPIPGGGSEFVVALPPCEEMLAQSDAEAPAPPSALDGSRPERAARRRVLVVDDNRDSAQSMALLLREMGHTVQAAFDGLEGLRAVAAFQPQVVLLDIGMPELDGHEVARRIRELPHASSITLVALTGFGQAEDRRRSLAAGFDLHLVKPVTRRDLDELLGGDAYEPPGLARPAALDAPPAGPSRSRELRQMAHDLRTPLNALWATSALLLETSLDPQQREYADLVRRSAEAIRRLADDWGGAADRGATNGRAGLVAPGPDRVLRILVVDDDPVNRTAILRLVDALGHRGESAADGSGALAAFERGTFDVVLMDVQMRGIGGPETARRMLGSHGNGTSPRILGVTGTALAADREACLAAGMEAVLVKPIDLATLREALAAENRGSKAERGPPGGELLDPRILSSLHSQSASPGRKALVEFLELYAADAPRQIERLRGALERGDAAELALTAHRLKGSSSAVGAACLAQLASRIESLARAGDVAGTAPLVAEFDRVWPATREALSSAGLHDAASGCFSAGAGR